MSKNEKKELVVIGAGPGGYAAAFRAADLGFNVTLIDPQANPGGACLFHGCIPAKTLLELLSVTEEAKDAEQMGLYYDAPKIDAEKIIHWKDRVVNELTEGIGLLAKERNIEYVRGTASFLSENELEVRSENRDTFHLEFEKVIIATGSAPREHSQAKIDHTRILDSTDALTLKNIPKSMLIIGGGFLGAELGSVYATLGTKVSLAEEGSGLISWVDEDLVKIFQKENEDLFEELHFKTQVTKIVNKNNQVLVKLKKGNEEWEKEYDRILILLGRYPMTETLNLDSAGIEKDEDGFIKVDQKQKTGRSNIYAIGDVTSEPMYANKATHEGRFAAEVIAGEDDHLLESKPTPCVVATTRTEMAWCGITEVLAKEKDTEVKVTKFPWVASGRAVAVGKANGLTKLVFDSKSGKLIGGGVVGKKAGSLISEIVLAIEMGATAEDISLSIHPHPTLSETIMEAAEMFSGNSTHFEGKQKKV